MSAGARGSPGPVRAPTKPANLDSSGSEPDTPVDAGRGPRNVRPYWPGPFDGVAAGLAVWRPVPFLALPPFIGPRQTGRSGVEPNSRGANGPQFAPLLRVRDAGLTRSFRPSDSGALSRVGGSLDPTHPVELRRKILHIPLACHCQGGVAARLPGGPRDRPALEPSSHGDKQKKQACQQRVPS